MPVTAEQPAPYAPASAVLDLVLRHRNKGLQSPVDADVLARSGISDSLIPRTLQALRLLDLLTEDGRPSEVLERIRLAPEAEYKQRLADWLTAAYADALVYVDPANDDEIAIRDAFRKYVPTGQQSRMVSLFMGLFTAAGVMPERQKQPPVRQPGMPKVTKLRGASPARQERVNLNMRDVKPSSLPLGSLPPALAGLMASLPAEGEGWTKARREAFMATLGAVIDFCFPIVPIKVERTDEADEQP